jgi:putative transposase
MIRPISLSLIRSIQFVFSDFSAKSKKINHNLKSDLPVEAIDTILKSGKDPLELMNDMKRMIMERVLNTEMNYHLGNEKNGSTLDGNYRNGYDSKTVRTDDGSIEIATPRDRDSSFDPQFIAKRQRSLKGFDQKIISLYARGMTMKEIRGHLEEIYGTEVSCELISNITDEVIVEVKEWQNRPLDKLYAILYLDAMVVKVRENGHVFNKSLYIALAVNMEGEKEILGIWIEKTEGAKFWLSVITELKNRGAEDILIACIDGLSGFSEAISTIFPKTEVQRCIVHMVRNSMKYVPHKNKKAVAGDLKKIYNSDTEELAQENLQSFKEKWDDKYPKISDSWEKTWTEVIPFLAYPKDIRKVIYTTNAIESTNRQIRKIIKSKGVFPNNMSVYKIAYLALQNASKSWTMPIQNWKAALNQFAILFGDRIE